MGGWRFLAWGLGLVGLAMGVPAGAQVGTQGGTVGEGVGTEPAGVLSADVAPMTAEELQALVAPVALYPDELLSQVLMAATYPVEVVQAERWAQGNRTLKGDALAQALEGRSWDASVRSLVNFPDVLKMMSEKLDWTVKLGDAFLAQQPQVLAAVQSLRAKAKDAGNLSSSEQIAVRAEPEAVAGGGTLQVIYIESSSPGYVYVPSYDPVVVYGAWPYPGYPPYSYYPPSYRPGYPGLAFGAGLALGAAWGYAWGDCDWNGGDIDIDVDRNVNIENTRIDRDKYKSQISNRQSNQVGNQAGNRAGGGERGRGQWQHDPTHRRGAAYRDTRTADRFGGTSSRQAAQSRDQFRGRTEMGNSGAVRGGVGVSDRSGGGGNFNSGGRNFNTGGSNFNTGGSNFNTGGSNFNTGGRNYNTSPSTGAFSEPRSSGTATRNASDRGQSSRSSASPSRSSPSRGGASPARSAPARSAPARGGGGGGRGGGGRR